jgi:hypothetical protein
MPRCPPRLWARASPPPARSRRRRGAERRRVPDTAGGHRRHVPRWRRSSRPRRGDIAAMSPGGVGPPVASVLATTAGGHRRHVPRWRRSSGGHRRHVPRWRRSSRPRRGDIADGGVGPRDHGGGTSAMGTSPPCPPVASVLPLPARSVAAPIAAMSPGSAALPARSRCRRRRAPAAPYFFISLAASAIRSSGEVHLGKTTAR